MNTKVKKNGTIFIFKPWVDQQVIQILERKKYQPWLGFEPGHLDIDK